MRDPSGGGVPRQERYADFLEAKLQHTAGDGITVTDLPNWLYPFQADLVEWALRRGRSAIFADCGMGKTPMQLAWADAVVQHTGKPALVVAPLAVTAQTVREATKFGIDAEVSRDGSVPASVTVTNYERLHEFDTSRFGGVVCDESSAIKAFDGTTRATVTEFLRTHRFRLLCTATAAPNDYIELGTSSEALGELGYTDMLSRWFTNRQRTAAQRGWGQKAEWRFKGHAEIPFWRWVASWARALRRPSDLGYHDDGYELPPLEYRRTVINADATEVGRLFDLPANGVREVRSEQRRTVEERCQAAAEALADADSAVAWCQTNAESDRLEQLLGAVQVSGSEPTSSKEGKLEAFTRGDIPILVTKPSIGAWGLNWQHCNRMTYFPSYSYEQLYQATRRLWRYGQQHPVTVDLITTDGGLGMLEAVEKKAEKAEEMFSRLVACMRDAQQVDRDNNYPQQAEVPAWLKEAN